MNRAAPELAAVTLRHVTGMAGGNHGKKDRLK